MNEIEFNKLLPLEKKLYSNRILKNNSDKVLINISILNENKENLRILISKNLSIFSILKIIKKKYNLNNDQTLFLHIKNENKFQMIKTDSHKIINLYNKFKDNSDNILYLYITFNECFGNN